MSDQDSSTSASSSQTDEGPEGEVDEELEGEDEGEGEGETPQDGAAPSLSNLSSSLRAVVRIKQKYQALKRRKQEQMGAGAGVGAGVGPHSGPPPTPTSSTSTSTSTRQARKKKRRCRKVMFPNGCSRRPCPGPRRSRAKQCLYLLCVIVFLQVYNAIENLDDHVLRYDLDGLEKTLRREVFGQQGAVEGLLSHLRDYLSTYVHNKPLVLSLHGPAGVGKSHLGRLLCGHFRAVLGDALVLHYYALHRCPLEANAPHCARNLSTLVAEMVEQAEEEEKIPLLVFDEAEHLHNELLDALRHLVATRQSNEYLNAIYLFLSNVGHAHITKHVLLNTSSSAGKSASGRHGNLAKELTPILRNTLEKLHPLWAEADILPLGLLDKGHIKECFKEEMNQEGFYPDDKNIERLVGEIEYYPAVGGLEYSKTGCKQVVAKVNLL